MGMKILPFSPEATVTGRGPIPGVISKDPGPTHPEPGRHGPILDHRDRVRLGGWPRGMSSRNSTGAETGAGRVTDYPIFMMWLGFAGRLFHTSPDLAHRS